MTSTSSSSTSLSSTSPSAGSASTPASAPPALSRHIGLAHYASRALLESVLGRHGLTFPQQITLQYAALAKTPLERDALVAEVGAALKIDDSTGSTVVEALTEAGLLRAQGSVLSVTGSGRERFDQVSADVAGIAARIYRDLPAEDLATAARVLSVVKERADGELAAASGGEE